jgi:hypothetical protein
MFTRYDITSEADIREPVARTAEHRATLPTTPTVVPLADAARSRAVSVKNL